MFYFDRDKPEKGIEERNPLSTMLRPHTYTRTAADGTRDVSREHEYGDLETKAQPVIQKIIAAARGRKIPTLLSSEKDTFDRFLYEQWRRVPDLRAKLFNDGMLVNEVVAESVNEYERRFRPLSSEERARLSDPAFRRQLEQNAWVDSLGRPSALALSALNGRGLAIAIPRDGGAKGFVLGSFPVLRMVSPGGRNHLSDHSVELWLPIAHDVAVGPGFDRATERLVIVPDADLRRLNRCVFAQSRKVVSRSRELIASLRDAR